jgi:hypothetical protein
MKYFKYKEWKDIEKLENEALEIFKNQEPMDTKLDKIEKIIQEQISIIEFIDNNYLDEE